MSEKLIVWSATAYISQEILHRKKGYVLRSGYTTRYHNSHGDIAVGSGFWPSCVEFEQTKEGLEAAMAAFDECVKKEEGPHSIIDTASGYFLKRHGYGFIAQIRETAPRGLTWDHYRVIPINLGVDIHREDPHRLRELVSGILRNWKPS